MKMHLLSLTLLSSLSALACSTDKAKQDTAPPTETAPLVTETEPPPEAKPVVAAPPRDPRIVEFFEAGKDCTWDEQGHTECPTAKAIKDLAFNNQGSSELAASCAGALTDETLAVRGLAATCMQGFNNKSRTPFLGAGLDAFEAEKDPGMRKHIAWSFTNGNASKAGVEDRLISLLEKLAGDKDEVTSASYLFRSMFPQYVMGTVKPTKAAGDFAIKMTKETEGPLQEKAIGALGLLTDRAEEICPVLIGLTNAETWTKTVPSMAALGGPCLADLEPVIGFMEEKLNTGKFFAGHSLALRKLLKKASLSKSQFARLKKASKKNLDAHKKTAYGNTAKKLQTEIEAYVDPAIGKEAPAK